LSLLDAPQRLVAPADAVTVVAVREDDDAPPAGLLADQLERADRRIEERGAAPWHQSLDRGVSQGGIALALGQHEDRFGEAEQGGGVARTQAREEALDRALHLRHRPFHAAADVDGGDELYRARVVRPRFDSMTLT